MNTTFTLAIILFFTMTAPAYAYIDMGTGSLIFQMLVAGLIGAGFTIKMYWRTLKNKVRHLMGLPVEEIVEIPLPPDDHHASRDSKD